MPRSSLNSDISDIQLVWPLSWLTGVVAARIAGMRGCRGRLCWRRAASVDLGKLFRGAGEADLQSFDFAEPAFLLGLADAGGQVVADLGQAVALGGSGQRIGQRMQACSWMQGVPNARPQLPVETLRRWKWPRNCCHSSAGGDPVFLGGAKCPPPGQGRQVGSDGFLGVDGLVAHGDADVLVAGDDLGDVGWQAVHDGIGDEQPAEIVRGAPERAAGGRVGQAGAGQRGVQPVGDEVAGDHVVLRAGPALEQQRGRRKPDQFMPVAAADQGNGSVAAADPADDRAEYVGELGADDQQPLGIGLGRGDLQQRHQFPAAGQAVLDQAVVG
jgi:hypothetical protein